MRMLLGSCLLIASARLLAGQVLPTTVVIAKRDTASRLAQQGAQAKAGTTARTGAAVKPQAAAKPPSAVKPGAEVSALVSFSGHAIDEWVALAVDDSSLLRRDRAVSALRRAPAAVRAAAVQGMAAALKDPVAEHRMRAIQSLGQLAAETQGETGHFDGSRDLTPVLPAIVEVAGDRDESVRGSALWLLSVAGTGARAVVRPVVRDALRDSSVATREAAVTALGIVGDSTDVTWIVPMLADPHEGIRRAATTALGSLGHRRAVPDLIRMLADSSRAVRAMALRALGELGAGAREALPAVARMVGDSSEWRSGSYAATIGEEAAWAASRILPRRGAGLIPALVDVDETRSALRGDGLGTYAAGADSVKAYISAALNLDLAGPRGDGRATKLAVVRPLRRSLVFDLSFPVPGSRAQAIPRSVRDNEAVVHLFYRHEHDKKMVSITMLDPTEQGVECERAEFQFRIDGEPYLLQMGEWSEGEFNPRAPKLNGAGTTTPRILHPSANEWTVTALPGSIARLWNLSDPSHPQDRGLYYFPFTIRWTALVTR